MNNFQSRKLVILYFTWTMRDRLDIARVLINRLNYYLSLRSLLWNRAVKWISAKFEKSCFAFTTFSTERCKIYSRYFLFIAFLTRFKVQFKYFPVDDCRQILTGRIGSPMLYAVTWIFFRFERTQLHLTARKIRSFTVISDILSQNKICFRLA